MICIIQARMSSTRLPRKSLVMINQIPLLQRVYNRTSLSSKISKIIVATSTNKEDDDIFNFCKSNNMLCHRGSLNDVAMRFIETINHYSIESFLRICADSPIIDPGLIDHTIENFSINNVDLTTNTYDRSFPKGQSVEILKSSILVNNYSNFNDYHKEHVTSYFHENHKDFKISSIKNETNYSHINHCIDSKEDLLRIEALIKKTKDQNYSWADYVKAELE